MHAFTLSGLRARQANAGRPYLEFLRVPDLSLGLYVLEAGSEDLQQAHTEDEAYLVLAGRAAFTAGDETRPVGAGDVLFVPARVPHRFHDIAETLEVLVMFGPAEGVRAGDRPPSGPG